MTDMVPMYGFGGGGQGGGRIRVYVDPGSQVTLTQTYGGKTKTAVADSKGQALFKGLDGGQWEAVATLNGQTANGSTIVSLDYQIRLTYFTATINITYPAGLTCKATNGNTVLTAPDTSGTWACTVKKAGTWAITAGDWSADMDITVSGQTETVRVAKWIVKNGGNTATGLSEQLITTQTATMTVEAGYLHLTADKPSGIMSGEKIDLTGVKTVIADIDTIVAGTSTNYAKFKGNGVALANAINTAAFGAGEKAIIHYALSTDTGRQTVSINADNITGAWYVGITMGGKGEANVYSLRLEV